MKFLKLGFRKKKTPDLAEDPPHLSVPPSPTLPSSEEEDVPEQYHQAVYISHPGYITITEETPTPQTDSGPDPDLGDIPDEDDAADEDDDQAATPDPKPNRVIILDRPSTSGRTATPDPGAAPEKDNWASLPIELQYLVKLIRYRMALEFHRTSESAEPAMPPYDLWDLPIGKFIKDYNLNNKELSPDEARLLLIGLVHHVQPDLFDQSIDSMLNGAGDFPKIGGTRGKNFRGFMPTGETALFLLAGDDWQKRLTIQQLFWADHPFARKKILWLEENVQGEPAMSGKINLSQDYVDIFTQGRTVPPHFSLSFPAKLVTTDRKREDLVINGQLNGQLNDLLDWIKFNKGLVTKGGQDGRFRNGYRCLFYGPSGTGKTFAASLLGKETGKEVYRIDLSMVVSKYIGETEKNLELLFARAENKKWILFFDEADALFGKRTNVRDAHDKYANQEVSYLLQRIEDYDGLVILATNMKNNIDDAFVRRFNAILKFPMPDAEERKKIWQNTFPRNILFKKSLPVPAPSPLPTPPLPAMKAAEPLLELETGSFLPSPLYYGDSPAEQARAQVVLQPQVAPQPSSYPDQGGLVDIPELVKKYVLSGGNISNIVHYASIKGAKRQEEYNRNHQPQEVDSPLTIYFADVMDGIRRELGKDGIPFA
jgi:hypothetical protein